MNFDTRKFMTNRTDFSQWLIDFAEDRMVACQKIGEKRALRYGDRSWQWWVTMTQEIFWNRVGYFSLMKL
jgi:hypothetical protein